MLCAMNGIRWPHASTARRQVDSYSFVKPWTYQRMTIEFGRTLRPCITERKNRQKRKDLPSTVELAVGMRVMVTRNIETDLDITNGARGEITEIVLHPDEPLIGKQAVVELKYL